MGTTIKLTPEEMKQLVGDSAPQVDAGADLETRVNAVVGGGMADSPMNTVLNQDDSTFRWFDTDDPNDIKREGQTKIVDGSTYEKDDLADNVPFPFAPFINVDNPFVQMPSEARNQKMYEGTGKAVIPGWEGGPRVQNDTDEMGNKETKFVPPQELDGIGRTVVGGAIEAAKGVTTLAGAVGDMASGRYVWDNAIKSLPLSEELQKELEDANPSMVKMIQENFPTMPAANGLEKAGQEIISVVIGGLGGGKLATEAIERLPTAQKYIAQAAKKFLERRLKKSGGLDVVNEQQKTEALIKGMLIEFVGSNAGATITTPDDVVPLTGNNFLDNTLASGVFKVVGVGGAKVADYLRRATGGKKVPPITEAGLAADLFRQFDPDVENVSKQEFVKRMDAFSRMIKANSEGDLGNLGKLKLSPAHAVDMGALDYVNESYGYMKESMGQLEFDNWARAKASTVANNIQAVKRELMSSSVVQTADAHLLERGQEILVGASNKYGGTDPLLHSKKIDDAATQIAEPALTTFNNAVANVDTAAGAERAAQMNLEGVTNKDAFLDSVDKLRGSSRFAQQDEMNIMKQRLSNQAYDRWEQSYKNYNDLYNNLPSGQAFDAKSLARMLKSFGDTPEIGNLFNLKNAPSSNNFAKIPDQKPGATGPSKLVNVEKNLAGKDMKWLLTEARPYFRKLIADAKKNNPAMDTQSYQDVISFIDNQAVGIPQFEAAQKAFAKHMDTWGQIPELKNISEQNKVTANSGGIEKERAQTMREIYKFQDQVFAAGGEDSGIVLDQYMKAYGTTDPEALQLLLAQVQDALVEGDGPTTRALSSALSRYMPRIKQVDEGMWTSLNSTLDSISMAEKDLGSKSKALAEAKINAATTRKKLSDTAAFNFIKESNVGPSAITGDPKKVLNSIFSDVDKTTKLISEAEATGNPLVIDGIKSQYLDNLTDDFFGNRVVSSTGDRSRPTTVESSLAKLNSFLDGKNDTGKKVLSTIFKDEPKFLEDVTTLFEVLRDDVRVRSNRPQMFGSDTSVNLAKSARYQAASLLTTVLFGRLNRTAATAGAFAKAINEAMSSTQEGTLRQFVPLLISDSKVLTEALDAIVANPNTKAVEAIVDNIIENKARLGNIVKGVITSLKDEEKPSTDNTEDAFTEPNSRGK